MADEIDRANDYEDARRESLLNSRIRYEGESAEECITCGEKIAPARRLAVLGCVRCRDCAEVLELMGRARR